jgi:hypothetical protein
MNKSLNQLIRDHKTQLVERGDAQREIAELHRLTAQGQGKSKGWHFSREEIYERTSFS